MRVVERRDRLGLGKKRSLAAGSSASNAGKALSATLRLSETCQAS